MKGCRIDTYFVKRSEPHSSYEDFFMLRVFGDFKHSGPNIWKGHYGSNIITVTQRGVQSDIRDQDITIEKNPDVKEDPDIVYAIPSKVNIALILDKHLNEIYR